LPPPDTFADDLIALLPLLRRYALSLCHRADLADDLVQTAVERAFAARTSRDPAVPLRPWAFRILRNAFIDDTRRRATRGETVDIADNPDLLSLDGARQTEDQLMLAAARAAMEALPADQRDVMHLVCIEEMSYAETAALLGIPTGTVMSRLSRARAAVARTLGIE
jgi:RNA polymerase sigma-70 factor (ECF subfamily)